MSKTKEWIMDLEEEFEDLVAQKIVDSEHISEVYAFAEKHKDKVAHWDRDERESLVANMWNEYWSKYV